MKLWQAFLVVVLLSLLCTLVGAVPPSSPRADGGIGTGTPLPALAPFPLPIRGPLAGSDARQPAVESAPSDYAGDTVTLINAERAAVGLAPLRSVTPLHDAADWHNLFMVNADCFAHVCPGEPGPGERARNAGYASANVGEIIAAGYITPQDTVTGWMNSAGHKANILGNYTDIGCGYLASDHDAYGTYWTCDFGSAGGASWPTMTAPPKRTPIPPITLPTATPRGALPPAGWVFRVELQSSAGWPAWDDLYYRFCASPLHGVTCTWYRQ